MGRITKDPAVRKQELVTAACELFKEKGFEQVSVSDIVGKVGVAQGTFYYYFKTKYDILDAVMDNYLRESVEQIEKVATDKNMNALEKIQAIIGSAPKPDLCEKNFIEYLHADENSIAHQKYTAKSIEMTVPYITSIVEEGIREGLFDVQQPRETVELMLFMYGYLNDSLAHTESRDEYYRKIRATEEIFYRVLGMKEGAVRLVS